MEDLLSHWDEKERLERFPLFWSSQMLDEIVGTTALEIFTIARNGVENEYELLRQLCPELANVFSLESYKKIWALINSRTITLPGSLSWDFCMVIW